MINICFDFRLVNSFVFSLCVPLSLVPSVFLSHSHTRFVPPHLSSSRLLSHLKPDNVCCVFSSASWLKFSYNVKFQVIFFFISCCTFLHLSVKRFLSFILYIFFAPSWIFLCLIPSLGFRNGKTFVCLTQPFAFYLFNHKEYFFAFVFFLSHSSPSLILSKKFLPWYECLQTLLI